MKLLLHTGFAILFMAASSAFSQCTTTVAISINGTSTGCGNRILTANSTGNTWTQKSNYGGGARYGATGFSIGSKGYIGTGSNATSLLDDFWEYDPATNAWTQRASFGGGLRSHATGFAIGTKGYIGTGFDIYNTRKNDFWEYDPASNTWAQRLNFAGPARSEAVGFTIGTKGYIGTGYNGITYNDLWEYNPTTNAWVQKAVFPGGACSGAIVFSIGAKGYIGAGKSINGTRFDFWEYDQATNTWSPKADIGALPFYNGAGFSIGNKGYVLGGVETATSVPMERLLQYNPATNRWIQVQGIGTGNQRQNTVAFTIGAKAYAGTGLAATSLNTFYEYEPEATYAWSSGANTQTITASGTATYSLLLTTAAGCTATASQAVSLSANPNLAVSLAGSACSGQGSTLTASGAGSYTWSANAGNSTNASVAVSPAASTIYTVSGSIGTCVVSYQFPLTINSVPAATLSANGPTLSCGPLGLSAGSTGNTWTQKAGLNFGRQNGVSFSIGNKGYVGTGTNTNLSPTAFDDFWEYDPITNAWTQKANFPNGSRYGAVGFSIGSKGYVGTGRTYAPSVYNDFWEFDPATNTWAQKATVSLNGRYGATGFSIGTRGYILTGINGLYGNPLHDFWEYNPATDTWTQLPAFPATVRYYAVGFSIGQKGYFGTGNYSNDMGDFWEYDPATSTWTQKAPYGGGPVSGAVAFSIGNKGYIGTGMNNYTVNAAFHEYDPVLNSWTQKASFGGSPRALASGFAIGNKGYISSGGDYSSAFYNDMWAYEPGSSIAWSNGAFTPSVNASSSGLYSFTLTSASGCTATASTSVQVQPTPTVAISGGNSVLCSGSSSTLVATGASGYTWSANAGGGNASSVVVSPLISSSYTLSATNGTCTLNIPVTVNVLPLPVPAIAASGPTLGCGTVSLGVNGGNIWTEKAGLATGRVNGVGFSIGTKGYIGTGNSANNVNGNLDDFWEYDPAANTWTQKANFGGGQRTYAVGLSIDGKGYVGTGFKTNFGYTNDFWEFDPAANTWTRKRDIGSFTRHYATAFSISNKGYIATGINAFTGAYLADLWEYTPATDTWVQKANLPLGRRGAMSFSIGNKGYLGMGSTATSWANDFYEYDPATNVWIAKTAYPGGVGELIVGFSILNRGYAGTGNTNHNNFYEYDPANNSWTQKSNFAGVIRNGAAGFSIGSKGYLGMGFTNLISTNYMGDLWQYDPQVNIAWSTGSTSPAIPVSVSGNYSVTVSNSAGCSAFSSQSLSLSPNPSFTVSGMSDLQCGSDSRTLTVSGASNYTWSANAGGNISSAAVVTPSATTIYTVSVNAGTCTVNYPVLLSVVASPVSSISVSGPTMSCGTLTLSSAAVATSTGWVQKASVPGIRGYAVGFSIGNKGYIGTGTIISPYGLRNDFWEYNPATNSWTQKANFAGGGRQKAVGFAIGNKGYIGTGVTATGAATNDLWEYDPTANTWTQKANMGTYRRYSSSCFTIGNKAYAGLGYDASNNSIQSDFWEYDPATDTWTRIADFGPGVRALAASFSIGNKGYVGTGNDGVSTRKDFWEYNPVTNIWTRKMDYGNGIYDPVYGATGFSLNNKGYIIHGYNTWYLNVNYEYNPITDNWAAGPNYGGSNRYSATAFVIGNRAYVATGVYNTTPFAYADMWQYDAGTILAWTGGATTQSIAATSGSYTLTVTNGGMCSTSSAQTISVTPIPTLAVSGPTSICNTNTLNLSVSGATSYTWSANAGSSTNSSVSLSPSSNTTYTVTGATNGCTATAVKQVSVYAIPIVSATATGTLICNGTSVTLNGSGATSYTWTGGINNTISFAPTTTADYTVTGSAAGNCTNTAVVTVSVKPTPTVTVNSGSTCAGQPFTLTPNGAANYTYSGTQPVVSPGITTSYTVTGTNSVGCTHSAIAEVTVYALPVIVANNEVVCAGSSYTFSPSGAASYTYSSGSNIISPAMTSTYSIAGTSTAGCMSSNPLIVTLTVNPLPTVTVNSGTVCNGQSFTLTPNGAFSYTYLPGGSAVISPNTTTSYSVSGADAYGCRSATTAIANVTVLISPTVTVNSGSVCAGQSFTMVPGGAVSYTYSNGSAIVIPGTTTSYTVTGVNAIGCPNASPAVATVTVNALPVITVTSDVICAGRSYTIVPSGASSYSYSSGSNVVTPAITSTYSIAGSSSVGCISSASAIITVTVSPLPVIAVNSGTICSGESFTLNPSGATGYTVFPGGLPVVAPLANSVYSVTGSNIYGCESAAAALATISVNSLPVVTANSGSVCSGSTFSIIPQGAASYSYSTGSATIMPVTTTTVAIVGTSSLGCIGSAVITVTVNATPTISLPANAGICAGGSYTILPAGADTYTYSSGSNVVTPVNTGTYLVTGSSLAGCQAVPALLTVSVQPSLTLTINGPTVVCEGQSILLTANGAATYTWNNGVTTPTLALSPANSTLISVNATGGYCTASSNQSITVKSSPTPTIESSHPVLCSGESASLSATGADTYLWSDGSTLSSIIISPAITTSYTLTGTHSNGCSSSTIVTQFVSDCLGINTGAAKTFMHVSIYPNPSNGLVTAVCNVLPENVILELYDTVGQLVASDKITSTHATLNYTQHANGMYTLRILQAGKCLSVTKIIKE